MFLFQATAPALKKFLLYLWSVSTDFPETLIFQVVVKSKEVIFTAFWPHCQGISP